MREKFGRLQTVRTPEPKPRRSPEPGNSLEPKPVKRPTSRASRLFSVFIDSVICILPRTIKIKKRLLQRGLTVLNSGHNHLITDVITDVITFLFVRPTDTQMIFLSNIFNFATLSLKVSGSKSQSRSTSDLSEPAPKNGVTKR